jgi:hypothetical protein
MIQYSTRLLSNATLDWTPVKRTIRPTRPFLFLVPPFDFIDLFQKMGKLYNSAISSWKLIQSEKKYPSLKS